MAVFERGGLSLAYEEFGSGSPLLLFAPGGMRSEARNWRVRPGTADEAPPWIDPTTVLADEFRVIAFDQRNAGASRGPIGAGDSWSTYASDALALLDHLGIGSTQIMGGCIGSSFALAMAAAAPQRVSAAVVQNPIGLSATNRPLFLETFDSWSAAIGVEHPEVTAADWSVFRNAMFGGDFVFSVSRSFVATCSCPLLVLPGRDEFHPAAIGAEIVSLAPRAELVDPWAGVDYAASTAERIRAFLRAHIPDPTDGGGVS